MTTNVCFHCELTECFSNLLCNQLTIHNPNRNAKIEIRLIVLFFISDIAKDASTTPIHMFTFRGSIVSDFSMSIVA